MSTASLVLIGLLAQAAQSKATKVASDRLNIMPPPSAAAENRSCQLIGEAAGRPFEPHSTSPSGGLRTSNPRGPASPTEPVGGYLGGIAHYRAGEPALARA